MIQEDATYERMNMHVRRLKTTCGNLWKTLISTISRRNLIAILKQE